MENMQTNLPASLDYKKKLKIFSILLFASNFMDVVYLDSTASYWENFACVLSFGLGCLLAYKLYQGAKWAEIFVYVFTIILGFGLLDLSEQTWHQQIVFVVQSLLMFSTLLFLLMNRQETRLHFGKPLRNIWFVPIVSVTVLFVVVSLGGTFVKKMIDHEVEKKRPLLTRESVTPQKTDDFCRNMAKYNDISTDDLTPFCNCFHFNFEKLVASKIDFEKSFWRNNPLGIGIESHAIAKLCKEDLDLTKPEQ